VEPRGTREANMGNLFGGPKRIRDTLYPEPYPFANTISVITKTSEFMEYCFVMLEYAKEHFKRQTFTLIAWPLPIYVVTNDVNNITHILKTKFENYPKGPDMKLRFQELLGDGIFNAE
jgi:hypothetical protein